jgi:hypothetical protein
LIVTVGCARTGFMTSVINRPKGISTKIAA